MTIKGKKHRLWRALHQHGAVLDVLVQGRRDKAAAKLLDAQAVKRHGRPRVIVTDKLRSYAAANNELGLNAEHRQHKGLNNRAENSHQPTRVRKKVMRRFKSARQLQRFASGHGQVSNLFMGCRYNRNAQHKREARTQASAAWDWVSCASMAP
ncbi:putative transposase [Burkholderia ambifaria]|nr:DDE-type integrase/transposase/recombinase [Burkholderia ambifaria]MDR6504154.1 putative transposase [Burkholderia ambifaria]